MAGGPRGDRPFGLRRHAIEEAGVRHRDRGGAGAGTNSAEQPAFHLTASRQDNGPIADRDGGDGFIADGAGQQHRHRLIFRHGDQIGVAGIGCRIVRRSASRAGVDDAVAVAAADGHVNVKQALIEGDVRDLRRDKRDGAIGVDPPGLFNAGGDKGDEIAASRAAAGGGDGCAGGDGDRRAVRASKAGITKADFPACAKQPASCVNIPRG